MKFSKIVYLMRIFLCITFLTLFSCQNDTSKKPTFDALSASWEQVEQRAKGSSVQLMMWQGDPLINAYMRDWVVPELRKRYDITLNIAPGQGNEIVKLLMGEQEARKTNSSIDMGWINGETFFQIRQIGALYGPFAKRLPNAQYIDFENPFIGIDFQQPVDGFECPWGNVQMCMIYDSVRTPAPPRTMADLEAYVRAHPGKFTIPYEFTGMTLLKAWMIAFAGGKDALNGPFDEAKYKAASGKLFAYINSIKPFFWRKGETFPESLAAMHQMFANAELDFTMSNNDNEVDNKIHQNIFPKTAKAYVFESGTIQNSHYWAIPKNAQNPAGAMTVINFLISPEAQVKKLNPIVWGDGTVLNTQKVPEPWKTALEQIPERKNAPQRKEIIEYALMEPASEYMIRLFADFRTQVIEQ